MTALCCGAILCACQQSTPTNTPKVSEAVQETQVYEVGNLFQITILPEMKQSDFPVLQDQFVMALFDGKEKYENLEVIAMGMKKSTLSETGDMKSLEEYAEYIDQYWSANNMNFSWNTSVEDQMEGMVRCITKDGKASQKTASSDAVVKYAENETMYFSVIMTGKKSQLDKTKSLVTVQATESSLAVNAGTMDYIYAMTAALDRVNGMNMLNNMKQIDELFAIIPEGANQEKQKIEYQKNVDEFQKRAQQNLVDSWSITDKASLEETIKWLVEEGHNEDALSALSEYGVVQDMSREALEQKMTEEGIDDVAKTYLLAAFDARAAYGENAVKAWDLSRVLTVLEMGYAAGYSTYEETLDDILEIAILTQQTYDSWENYNKSYLYGYAYWAEESLDDPASSAYERQEILNSLETEEGGLFSVDWNLELKKEW